MKPATKIFLAGAVLVLAAGAVYHGILAVPFVFGDPGQL